MPELELHLQILYQRLGESGLLCQAAPLQRTIEHHLITPLAKFVIQNPGNAKIALEITSDMHLRISGS